MSAPEPPTEEPFPLALPPAHEVEGYRMTYTLMIALSAQRFMAIGVLFAATGFVASNVARYADAEKTALLPLVGLLAVMVAISVAGRQIVRSLNQATLNLVRRCAEIERALGITQGFGHRYDDYVKQYGDKPRGTYAAEKSAQLLSFVVAFFGAVILLERSGVAHRLGEVGTQAVTAVAFVGVLLGALFDEFRKVGHWLVAVGRRIGVKRSDR